MKKALLFILLIGMIAVNGTAQVNYVAYHQNVNQAKILIAEGKYEQALTIYHEVFQKFPKNFYRDIHNACACAIRCGKNKDAAKLTKKLILHGYQMKDFNTPAFKSFKTTDQWKEIERQYPDLRKKYENSLDAYQYQKYRYMLSHDQMLTRMDDYEEQNKAIYEFTTLVKMDYEQNGIPNFVRFRDRLNTGYMVFYRHLFGKRGRALESGSYDYVRKLDSLHIKELLGNEVFKGSLSPRFVVTAESYYENEYGINSEIEISIDFENESVSFSPSYNQTHRNRPVCPHVDFATINNNRKRFGMLPLEVECQLFMSGTWYTQYPFKEIKKALQEGKGEDLESVKKRVKAIENECRKTYSNALQRDFYLTDYHAYMHTKYIGLEEFTGKGS